MGRKKHSIYFGSKICYNKNIDSKKGGKNLQKVIVVPDSFKGSMTSREVADILAASAKQYLKCETVRLPIADGGEGSLECILRAKGGNRKLVRVHSPENKLIEAAYGILEDGTAVIEIAQSSGLTRQTGFHALDATTYGFGELITAALNAGYRKFYLCLGGSATTDCGCGMAAALGARFYNKENQPLLPTGGSLSEVTKIDWQNLDPRIAESTFTVMSDVTNPLYGHNGAAYIYAPQKGASEKEVEILDDGLSHVSKVIECNCHVDPNTPAAGAAGGVGYGCMAFLNAKVVSGIDGMLQLFHFDEVVQNSDLIVTGEGCLDEQSLMGKVLSGIRRHSRNKEIVSFCGKCTVPAQRLAGDHITAVEIATGIPIQEAMQKGREYLTAAANSYFESYREGSREHSELPFL